MKTKFFLSSLESEMLSEVRSVDFLKEISFDTGKQILVAKISPKLPCDNDWKNPDYSMVAISPKYEMDGLTKIKEFPYFVHVAFVQKLDLLNVDLVKQSDFDWFSWGELYRTADDAKNHRFDK